MVIRTLDTGSPLATYPTAEPPAILEVRLALAEVNRAFINESVQATSLGLKELDSGKFVTLEDLELQIKQAK